MRKIVPAIILRNNLERVQESKKRPLVIAEAGSVADGSINGLLEDGWSTVYIARWVQNSNVIYKHEFYSIDLNTAFAKEFLVQKGLEGITNFVDGTSTELLASVADGRELDFVYLDTYPDPDLVCSEFEAVYPRVSEGGCIVVDDIFENEPSAAKGEKLIPLLKERDIKYTISDQLLVIEK